MLTGLKTRLAIAAMLLALVGVVAAGPLSAAAAPSNQGSGTAVFSNPTGTALTSDIVSAIQGGTLSNLSATSNGPGALPTISGTLSGVLNGQAFSTPFTAPVLGDPPSASCTILDLTLGPLDLNLLGLMVHLDTVHLVITAQPGSGNLLGNLLCAVANLLNNTGATGNALTNLLNRIFALL